MMLISVIANNTLTPDTPILLTYTHTQTNVLVAINLKKPCNLHVFNGRSDDQYKMQSAFSIKDILVWFIGDSLIGVIS